MTSTSSASRTTTGTSRSPACTEAWYRRSPAMIWKRLPRWRTTSGSMTPFSATEAMSSDRSPIACRG